MNDPLSPTPPNICPLGSPSLPVISVIIVSWNASKFLEECIDSLSRGVALPYEVIVVDNASSDGSPEMLAAKFPWVQLIQSGANLGFSKGNNLGLRQSRGKYYALVNSDVNVFPDCLDKLSRFLDEHPDVGMVGPRVLSGDGRLQISCRRFPNLWNSACEVFRLHKLFPSSAFFGGEEMFFFDHRKLCEVEVLSGCFIVARRSAVEQFGLLDESFFFYAEDVDWCRRCTQSGWKILFCPDAESIHYGGGSSSNDPKRFAATQLKARLHLWAKYYSIFSQWGFVCILIFHCSLRLFAAWIVIIVRSRKKKDPVRFAQNQIAGLKAILHNLPRYRGAPNRNDAVISPVNR